jgi:hypothetical protein
VHADVMDYGDGCWRCIDAARPRCPVHADVMDYGDGCWQCIVAAPCTR